MLKPLFYTLQYVISGFCKVFFRHKVYGLQHVPHGKTIVAPSHTSYYDPIIVFNTMPDEVYFLAKVELFRSAFFKKIMTALNAHPVSGTVSDLSTFRLIGDILKENKKVVIFPEGMRTLDGNIGQIKHGIGMLAQRYNSSILPVYIHGAYDIWPVQRKFPKLFGHVASVIGSPIIPQNYWQTDKRLAQEEITREVETRLRALREWYLNGAVGDPP